MDGLQRTTQLAESWWQSFYYYFSVSPEWLTCESFWPKGIGAFVAIGGIAVVAGIWKYPITAGNTPSLCARNGCASRLMK
jgi:hypothetical protein